MLFSRIGVPLIHRYRVFSRAGTHVAFRGTYMAKLRTFLDKSDAACLQSRNRRRARAITSQMSPTTPLDAHSREPDKLSQPRTSRRPSSQVRTSASVAAVAAGSLTPVVVRSLRSSHRAVPATLTLTLTLCQGTPGPPGCRSDGGHGAVAALPGSGTPPVKYMGLY